MENYLRPWTGTPTLIGRRLGLEPLGVEHAAEMAPVLGDPGLHRFTGGEPASPEELARTYGRLVSGPGEETQRWLNWIVRRREDGQAVGTTQATLTALDSTVTAEVAWVIGRPYQGQGLASEAALLWWPGSGHEERSS